VAETWKIPTHFGDVIWIKPCSSINGRKKLTIHLKNITSFLILLTIDEGKSYLPPTLRPLDPVVVIDTSKVSVHDRKGASGKAVSCILTYVRSLIKLLGMPVPCINYLQWTAAAQTFQPPSLSLSPQIFH